MQALVVVKSVPVEFVFLALDFLIYLVPILLLLLLYYIYFASIVFDPLWDEER